MGSFRPRPSLLMLHKVFQMPRVLVAKLALKRESNVCGLFVRC